MTRIATATTTAVVVAAAVGVGTSAAPAARVKRAAPKASAAATPPYMNPNLSIRSRVADLLGRMTLEEKVGQMDQIVVGRLRAATDPGDGSATAATTPSCRRAACNACWAPGVVGACLGDADDDQREKADQHVRADALVLAVEHRPQGEGALEVAEGALGFEQLLVAERDVFGR
jgi:hypothetical protein